MRIATVDTFGYTDVDVMKIDVEGHEALVLEGAAQTIQTSRPVLIIEIEQRHHKDGDIEDVFAMIQGLGYEGYFLHEKAMRPIRKFEKRKHQNLDLFGRRGAYINNFIFLSRGRKG